MQYLSKRAAGKYMSVSVPILRESITVAEAEVYIRKQSHTFSSIHYIYLINDQHGLVGVISLRQLLQIQNGNDALLHHATRSHVITVRPTTDRDRVIQLALKHNLKALPVISKEHIFLGAIISDTLMTMIRDDHTSEVFAMAGVQNTTGTEIHDALLYASSWSHVRMRLPWLMLGLCGGLLAASVIGYFEETLADMIVLAAFIPAIVYVADAVGAQSQILFIRALSIDPQLIVWRYVVRDGVVTCIVAACLAVFTYATSLLWLGDALVSTILAVAVFLTVLCAVTVAIVLPALLLRRGIDPAVASGPLATVVRDVLSLFIYLGVATILLS